MNSKTLTTALVFAVVFILVQRLASKVLPNA